MRDAAAFLRTGRGRGISRVFQLTPGVVLTSHAIVWAFVLVAVSGQNFSFMNFPFDSLLQFEDSCAVYVPLGSERIGRADERTCQKNNINHLSESECLGDAGLGPSAPLVTGLDVSHLDGNDPVSNRLYALTIENGVTAEWKWNKPSFSSFDYVPYLNFKSKALFDALYPGIPPSTVTTDQCFQRVKFENEYHANLTKDHADYSAFKHPSFFIQTGAAFSDSDGDRSTTVIANCAAFSNPEVTGQASTATDREGYADHYQFDMMISPRESSTTTPPGCSARTVTTQHVTNRKTYRLIQFNSNMNSPIDCNPDHNCWCKGGFCTANQVNGQNVDSCHGTSFGNIKACFQCVAGKYYNSVTALDENYGCTDCAPGTFRPTDASIPHSECRTCAEGQYQDKPGQTGCDPCGACQIGQLRTGCGTINFYDSPGQCNICDPLPNGNPQYLPNGTNKCEPCVICPPGRDMAGCSGTNAGECILSPKPVITNVETVTSPTEGGTTFDITAENVGGLFDREKYEKYLVKQSTFVAFSYANDDVLSGHVIEAVACDLVPPVPESGPATIRCSSGPGVGGPGFVGILRVGFNNSNGSVGNSPIQHKDGIQFSAKFPMSLSYIAPVVQSFSGPGSGESGTCAGNADPRRNGACTIGSDLLIIRGLNFGPSFTSVGLHAIDNVTYGDPSQGLRFRATDCNLTAAHEEITCLNAPGAGDKLALEVWIGGQRSESPKIKYASPSIDQYNSSEPHPAFRIVSPSSYGLNASTLRTEGGDRVEIRGQNFGRIGPVDIDRVTYGPVGTKNVASNCTVDRTVGKYSYVRCTTAPGIGIRHEWRITVQGQISPPFQRSKSSGVLIGETTSYALPTLIGAPTPASGPTRGVVDIKLRGKNFGTKLDGATHAVLLKNTLDGITEQVGATPASCDDGGAGEDECVVWQLPRGYGTLEVLLSVRYQGSDTRSTEVAYFEYSPPVIDNIEHAINHTDSTAVVVSGDQFGDYTSQLIAGGKYRNVYACMSRSLSATDCCAYNKSYFVNGSLDSHACRHENIRLNFSSWSNNQVVVGLPLLLSGGNAELYVVVGAKVSTPRRVDVNGTRISTDVIPGLESGTLAVRTYRRSRSFAALIPVLHKTGENSNRVTRIDSMSSNPVALRVSRASCSDVAVRIQNVPTDLAVNCSGPVNGYLLVSFILPDHQCTESREIVNNDVPNPNMCFSVLRAYTGSVASNAIYIAHERPTLIGIDLIAPGVEVPNIHTPGSRGRIPTDGTGKVRIRGRNLGNGTKSDKIIFVEKYLNCEWIVAFSEVTCAIPKGQGSGLAIVVSVGHSSNEGNVLRLSYSPPSVERIRPDHGGTVGGTMLYVFGQNFGINDVAVSIGGVPCLVLSHPNSTYLVVKTPPGQGGGLDVKVRVSTVAVSPPNALFSYDLPTVSAVHPAVGPTSGHGPYEYGDGTLSVFSTSGDDITFRGSGGANFQRTIDKGAWIRCKTDEGHYAQFTVKEKPSNDDFLVVTDRRTFPPGVKLSDGELSGAYEISNRLRLTIIGSNFGTDQGAVHFSFASLSSPGNIFAVDVIHAYSSPAHDNITVLLPPGFGERIGVVASVGGQANAPSGTAVFAYASPHIDSIVPYCGVDQNKHAVQCMGAGGFETDGCTVEKVCAGVVSTVRQPCPANASSYARMLWEDFDEYEQRVRRLTPADRARPENQRYCGKDRLIPRWQQMVIRGSNFGARELMGRLSITVSRPECDCTACMNAASMVCLSAEDGVCPEGTKDCRTASLVSKPMVIVHCNVEADAEVGCTDLVHHHNEIWVRSPRGFGRNLSLVVHVDFRPSNPQLFHYEPPTIESIAPAGDITRSMFHASSTVIGGSTGYPLVFAGRNFGDPTSALGSGNASIIISIRMGTSVYSTVGMKACTDAVWKASLAPEISASIPRKYLGLPYLVCTPAKDVAGFRNISVSLFGQTDDCQTNAMLCADPVAWPGDRRARQWAARPFDMGRAVDGSGQSPRGPVFTCGRNDSAAQAYGGLQELCVPINRSLGSMECGDRMCTLPVAREGHYRLQLDIQLSDEPAGCNRDKAGECPFRNAADAKRALGYHYKPWDRNSASLTQYSWQTFPELPCTVNEECSTKVGAECVTRDTPGVDEATARFEATSDPSRPGLCGLPSFIPRCPKERYVKLIQASTMQTDVPMLEHSKHCFDIVGCTPKTSCMANNICAHGYDHVYLRCLKWAATNAQGNASACVQDSDCSSRSGSANGPSSGSAMCDPLHPEDCAKCIRINPTDPTGRCECVPGGPRCALCTLGVPDYTRARYPSIFTSLTAKLGMQYPPLLPGDTGMTKGTFEAAITQMEKALKLGYYRRDLLCQVCPACPACIIVGFLLLVFFVVGMAVYLDRAQSKFNFAFISIGIDYFQIIALFAQTGIPWPAWMKEILQILSIFNFNIDIAAPECLVPDFDFTLKWWGTVLLPVAVLFLLAFMYFVLFCIKRFAAIRIKSKHGDSMFDKLYAAAIISMYYMYISVTQRAFSIFDCNPPNPPDGYTYTSFTSSSCPGGFCKCDDALEPTQLNMQLPAILFICLYTVGYPLVVMVIIMRNKERLKMDQMLRAHGIGDTLSTNPHAYKLRQRYHKLYYHFKPGKIYWMLVLLARKALVNAFMLLFRNNEIFMYSMILMVLFLAYTWQVKHTPFMSPVELHTVLDNHKQKYMSAMKKNQLVEEWQAKKALHDFEEEPAGPLRNEKQHLEIYQRIERLLKAKVQDEKRTKSTGTGKFIRGLAHARAMAGATDQEARSSRAKFLRGGPADYYFDYNTVEQVLLMCAILLCLCAIMFKSGRFDNVSTVQDILFREGLLVFAGGTIVLSLVYYLTVLLSEVVGFTPRWIKAMCGKTRREHMLLSRIKSAHQMAFGRHMPQQEMELAEMDLHGNPMHGLTMVKKQAEDAARERDEIRRQYEHATANNQALVNVMKKMKKDAQQQGGMGGGKSKSSVIGRRASKFVGKAFAFGQVRERGESVASSVASKRGESEDLGAKKKKKKKAMQPTQYV